MRDQRTVDRLVVERDGSDDRSTLGANAILGVSLAVAKGRGRLAGLPCGDRSAVPTLTSCRSRCAT